MLDLTPVKFLAFASEPLGVSHGRDTAWPGLVAAIATADPKRWTPRDLLHLAAEQLADADPDGRSIAAYEYARWITHTVDMVTTSDPTAHPHHNLPTPDHAPLTREEEEELAGLDPQHITPDDELPTTGSWRRRRLAEMG